MGAGLPGSSSTHRAEQTFLWWGTGSCQPRIIQLILHLHSSFPAGFSARELKLGQVTDMILNLLKVETCQWMQGCHPSAPTRAGDIPDTPGGTSQLWLQPLAATHEGRRCWGGTEVPPLCRSPTKTSVTGVTAGQSCRAPASPALLQPPAVPWGIQELGMEQR